MKSRIVSLVADEILALFVTEQVTPDTLLHIVTISFKLLNEDDPSRAADT